MSASKRRKPKKQYKPERSSAGVPPGVVEASRPHTGHVENKLTLSLHRLSKEKTCPKP
jgi:hypothetical protein